MPSTTTYYHHHNHHQHHHLPLLPLAFLLLLLLLPSLPTTTAKELTQVRLSEGTDRNPPTPPPDQDTPTSTSSTLHPHRPPYGPALLKGIKGEVVKTVTDANYEYVLHMFEKVTQRKMSESAVVVLGVWDRWEVVEEKEEEKKEEKDELKEGEAEAAAAGEKKIVSMKKRVYRMHYTEGSACVANLTRSAVVDFQCDASMDDDDDDAEDEAMAAVAPAEKTKDTPAFTSSPVTTSKNEPESEIVGFALSNIKEPTTCTYTLTLRSPIPCAVFARELASFHNHPPRRSSPCSSDNEEEDDNTKVSKKKGKKHKSTFQLHLFLGKVLGGLWKKMVAKIKKERAAHKAAATARARAGCVCGGDVNSTESGAGAGTYMEGEGKGKERKGQEEQQQQQQQMDALVSEVGQMRSQLTAFIEEQRGTQKEKEGGGKGESNAAGVGSRPFMDWDEM